MFISSTTVRFTTKQTIPHYVYMCFIGTYLIMYTCASLGHTSSCIHVLHWDIPHHVYMCLLGHTSSCIHVLHWDIPHHVYMCFIGTYLIMYTCASLGHTSSCIHVLHWDIPHHVYMCFIGTYLIMYTCASLGHPMGLTYLKIPMYFTGINYFTHLIIPMCFIGTIVNLRTDSCIVIVDTSILLFSRRPLCRVSQSGLHL